MDLNSIERIQEYSSLQSEKYHTNTDDVHEEEEKEEEEVSENTTRSRAASGSPDSRNSARVEWNKLSTVLHGGINLGFTGASNHGKYLPVSDGIEMSTLSTSTHEDRKDREDMNNLMSDEYRSRHHNWPSVGRVEFKGIYLQYNSSATPVLRCAN